MVNRVFSGLDVALAFEPGRMIAANAGALVARVVRVQERPTRPILVLDAGMNDLIRPAIYDAYHEIRPVRAPEPDAARQAYDVVGPICETGDTFTRGRVLPQMQEGDLAAFMTAGAYGAAMASTYNARALVPEVLVRGNEFEIVRRRWDIVDQIALERVPAWLGGP
jgi:diaminopimelate decarboxylase